MPSRLEILIDLLHSAGDAALATQSVAMPGYPFATSVPFATDEHHRPVMVISRLAEHTQNLIADAKASLMLAQSLGEGETARVSLVGEILPIDADARLVARYLRFHPEAERFLQLGDFRFHRFEPKRIRIVGGFGNAGWLDGTRLSEAPHIGLEEEAKLLAEAQPRLPDGITLLGIDAYGVDIAVDGVRGRRTFATGPVAHDAVLPTLLSELHT
jgi:putative heme iron utilization protein